MRTILGGYIVDDEGEPCPLDFVTYYSKPWGSSGDDDDEYPILEGRTSYLRLSNETKSSFFMESTTSNVTVRLFEHP